jgi:xylulose-5-phosphate/fructose-6-phosphate phosphoketolase
MLSRADVGSTVGAWTRVADAAAEVQTESVAALWRALNYLCAGQLYLADNVRLDASLSREHVKATPRGHWGVCPPVNLALAAVAPLHRVSGPSAEIAVIHGAGHAGPAALAYGYLTGTLGRKWAIFTRSRAGLRHLVTAFPHQDGVGSEITPMFPGHVYTGGQLGPALAFATGHVLDAPKRLAVVLIGDGECETGSTSAAWLGTRVFNASGDHGVVLPIVLLNGLRMGGPSLLGGLTRQEQIDYFAGQGFAPIVADQPRVPAMRAALDRALRNVLPLGSPGRPPVILLMVPKGATGPESADGRAILGTPRVHKTPLRNPRENPAELDALRRWLASYAPEQLIDEDGQPTPLVSAALPATTSSRQDRGPVAPPEVDPVADGGAARSAAGQPFGVAVTTVVTRHASVGGFRIFSPDELTSNHLSLASETGALPSWAREVLNEELCHAWLQGYLEGGGRGLFISYEAFASVNTSLVQQYLKHRAAARVAGLPSVASMNYLLTSLGWNNTFTHQNPGLVSSLIETEDPTVRIFTPADAVRVGAALDEMLCSTDRVNVMVADKHASNHYPAATVHEELRCGAAVWAGVSCRGTPDLVIAAAGDVATNQALPALASLRVRHPAARVRFVQVMEITSLGDPATRPHALPHETFAELFPDEVPVLLVAPGYPGAYRSLLWSRPGAADRFTTIGFREPPRPRSPAELLRFCGMDSQSLCATAHQVLTTRHRRTRSPISFQAAHDRGGQPDPALPGGC